MFAVEILKGNEWKKDRVYKIFENAEKRVMEFQHNGMNSRMIEVRK